jgi:hypothetical protein
MKKLVVIIILMVLFSLSVSAETHCGNLCKFGRFFGIGDDDKVSETIVITLQDESPAEFRYNNDRDGWEYRVQDFDFSFTQWGSVNTADYTAPGHSKYISLIESLQTKKYNDGVLFLASYRGTKAVESVEVSDKQIRIARGTATSRTPSGTSTAPQQTQASAVSGGSCTTPTCNEIDNVWSKIVNLINPDYAGQVYDPGVGWVIGGTISNPGLKDVNIPSKKAPGNFPNSVISEDTNLRIKEGVDSGVTKKLVDALNEFVSKSRQLGFSKEIVITDAKRQNNPTSHSHHNSGNAVDIRTRNLNLNERLILIRAAIESGFGEIYHGEQGKILVDSPVQFTDQDNLQLQCFWLENHADHLHLALENQNQGWENCIKR